MPYFLVYSAANAELSTWEMKCDTTNKNASRPGPVNITDFGRGAFFVAGILGIPCLFSGFRLFYKITADPSIRHAGMFIGHRF